VDAGCFTSSAVDRVAVHKRVTGYGNGMYVTPIVMEVPQPSEPATPAVPDAPVTPINPDPGTPSDPEEPAVVPDPQEPPTPAVPEPGPEEPTPNQR
jgi:hypothetical protein